MSNFLPAKHGFKMACLNIDSLVTEIDMVEGYIVGFYIKSPNSYIVRSDLNVINLENLTINSNPFLVATWYRPPCFPTDLFSSY